MLSTRQALCVAACLLLVACGGGGGGSGSSSSSSSSGGTPPPPAGSFTLSTSTAAFRAPRQRDTPVAQTVTMAVTGSGVADVAATMPAGQVASWLAIGVAGTSPNYTITLRPNTTFLDLGTATTTVRVVTTNSAGAVLVSRDIQVSYEIYQGITYSANSSAMQSFVFGGAETGTGTFTLNALGRNYTTTSTVPWLTAPAGTQSGNGPIAFGVNVATLTPGTYFGSIRVAATGDPADAIDAVIQADVAPPTLATSTAAMVIGGADGLGSSLSGTLDLSLNTGANSWPWTVQVQGFSVPAAISTPVTSGSISGTAGATFTFSANRAQLRPGSYTATLHFATTVKGQVFTRDVPLTLNWESQRLVPRFDGLAFTSTPARAPVARQVVIGDSRGRTGIPWSATVDAPWLHVSPASGVTGDTLTVTVTPAALASNSLYNGNIVLTSTSPVVERPETIRVALWKSSTNPVNVSRQLTDLSGSWVANPVEPWVYSISREMVAQPGGFDGQAGGIIRVYHVFSGDLLATFQSGATLAGSMTISSDGTRLFVTDYGTPRTIELDALSGAQLAIYPASQMPFAGYDERHGIVFLRMNGRPVVWPAFTPGATAVLPIDVETGQGLHLFSSDGFEFSPRYDTFQAASPDGQFVFTSSASYNGILNTAQHYFSALGGGPRIRGVPGTFFARGFGSQGLCVSLDNKVWQSTGYMPMVAYDSHLENVVATLTMPASTLTYSVICGTYGRHYMGIADSNGNGAENNVAIFTDAGALLGTYRHGAPSQLIQPFSMALSGDGSRIIWPSYSLVGNHLADTLVISTPP